MKLNLVGYYNVNNVGDDAIRMKIQERIPKKHDISINGCQNKKTALEPCNTFDIGTDFDLTIIGGGGLFSDPMIMWLKAGLMKDVKPKIVHGVGACSLYGIDRETKHWEVGDWGYHEVFHKRAAELINKSESITVRDPHSKKCMQKLGVTKPITVTGDPAINLKCDISVPKDRPLEIGITVRPPFNQCVPLTFRQQARYFRNIAKLAEYMVDKYYATITYLPFNVEDLELIQFLRKITPKKYHTHMRQANTIGRVDRTIAAMGMYDFFLGARYHSIIFASKEKCPFITLEDHPKVTALREDIGTEDKITPFMTFKEMKEQFDYSFENKEEMKHYLEKRIPKLQKRELKNEEILRQFL